MNVLLVEVLGLIESSAYPLTLSHLIYFDIFEYEEYPNHIIIANKFIVL